MQLLLCIYFCDYLIQVCFELKVCVFAMVVFVASFTNKNSFNQPIPVTVSNFSFFLHLYEYLYHINNTFSNSSCNSVMFLIVLMVFLLVAANGEEAWRGASSAHTVWYYSRKLAGKPHPEGVPESLLSGPSGHTLPGCWTGRETSLEGLDNGVN